MIEFTVRIKKLYLLIAMAVFALITMLLLTVTFFNVRDSWIVLFANRNHVEISQVANALEFDGIRHRISPDWTRIYVREQDRTEATVAVFRNVAIAPDLPLNGAINVLGLGTTEPERIAILLAAAQNDIANVLKSIEGIEDAQVTITPPERALLSHPISASVGVVLFTAREFSQEEVARLAELLRTMVLGLETENITITDQNLTPLFVGGEL
ncbi:MAG: hypothetical protein FWC16_10315 [Defluviitaleaceae bacterium]|nr:hypothetical protein [Defluviitaleaceae bacterium]MCL2275310.1 hypothetical protein [Defluviitaleaceae bacterium]